MNSLWDFTKYEMCFRCAQTDSEKEKKNNFIVNKMSEVPLGGNESSRGLQFAKDVIVNRLSRVKALLLNEQ